ncbi:MAG: sigma-70 family RNA polymerase sigma factor [Rhodothermales bacterium]|nr:sigma-70 family RNA polymerase sigma factor [Rhodothermales bacterium]MBO6778215.1 sigma-70 family RNA polymerase sigma factor [Rhodothermales bacterium]
MTLSEFELTVTRHQNRVFGYAARLLGDRDQAKDVVQDAMLRMWKHRDRVDEDGAVSWLLRVTHNACIDVLRRRQLEHRIFDGEPDADRTGSATLSPARQTESADMMAHLERAIETLKEPYRSIVVLREIEDFRYEEICGALNLPMSTVKVYLHRARRMLRKTIEEVMHLETA